MSAASKLKFEEYVEDIKPSCYLSTRIFIVAIKLHRRRRAEVSLSVSVASVMSFPAHRRVATFLNEISVASFIVLAILLSAIE
ncbi:hypothetical protein QYF36_022686 [Acer negundo]|nr:hypothetical protein QYF36_022686 [Acer negundo]